MEIVLGEGTSLYSHGTSTLGPLIFLPVTPQPWSISKPKEYLISLGEAPH